MQNYSKENQDLFALNVAGKDGFYLDIGCRTPEYENNTKLLEQNGWTGFMFDIDPYYVTQCNQSREGAAFCVDVTTPKFVEILEEYEAPKQIDYVSLDVDDASIACLTQLLEAGYQIGCMTFEHVWNLKDDFIAESNCTEESRRLLTSYGYVPLFLDVTLPDGEHAGKAFEDWWVHPNIHPTYDGVFAMNVNHDEALKQLVNYLNP